MSEAELIERLDAYGTASQVGARHDEERAAVIEAFRRASQSAPLPEGWKLVADVYRAMVLAVASFPLVRDSPTEELKAHEPDAALAGGVPRGVPRSVSNEQLAAGLCYVAGILGGSRKVAGTLAAMAAAREAAGRVE